MKSPELKGQWVAKCSQLFFLRWLVWENDAIGIPRAAAYTSGFTDPATTLNLNPIRRSAMYSADDYALKCQTVLFGGNYAQCSININSIGKVFQYKLTYAHSQSVFSSTASVWCNASHTDDLALVFGEPFI
jgi:hypothetical protein